MRETCDIGNQGTSVNMGTHVQILAQRATRSNIGPRGRQRWAHCGTIATMRAQVVLYGAERRNRGHRWQPARRWRHAGTLGARGRRRTMVHIGRAGTSGQLWTHGDFRRRRHDAD